MQEDSEIETDYEPSEVELLIIEILKGMIIPDLPIYE